MRRLTASAIVALLVTTACAEPAATPGASPAPAATALAATAAPAATPAPAPKPPAERVTFLTDFVTLGYTAPFWGGLAQGFFKDESIELTISPGAGSADTATKVGAAAAQFGLVDSVSALLAIGRRTPITLVAAHFQKHVGGFCYVAGRREVRTWKDFEGLRIGGNAEDAYLRVATDVMKEKGFDPSKISFTAMDAQTATAALNAGQLDSISCGLSTFPSRAVTAKQANIDLRSFAFADNGFDALGHQIVVNNGVLRANPGLVQRFVNAYAKSMVWGQLNQDKAMDAYMKENPQQIREGEKANFTQTIPLMLDKAAAGDSGMFYIPPTKLKETVDRVKQWYQVQVDPTTAATNEFALKVPLALRQGKLP